MKKGITEIFKAVDAEKDTEKKVHILRENHSTVMWDIFRLLFNSGNEWKLSKKRMDYKPFDGPDAQGALYYQFKKVPRYFLSTSTTDIDEKKLTLLWIQLLESIDAEDAKFMEFLRLRKNPYKSINRKLIDQTFPGLLDEVKND